VDHETKQARCPFKITPKHERALRDLTRTLEILFQNISQQAELGALAMETPSPCPAKESPH